MIANLVHIFAWLPVLSAEEVDIGKLVFFAIAIIVWIVSAIGKAINKSSQKQQTWTGDEWPADTTPEATATEASPVQEWVPPPVATPPSHVPPVPARQHQQPVMVPAEWHKQTSSHVPTATTYSPAASTYAPASTTYAPTVTTYAPQGRPSQVMSPAAARQVASRPPPVPRAASRKAAAAIAEVLQVEERSAYEAPPAARLAAATTTARRGTPSLDAAALRRWMTPRVMREQYVLTELFDPPPSMRQDESTP